MTEIARHIKSIVGDKNVIYTGRVKSVNRTNMTCIVVLEGGGGEIEASLQVGDKSKGLVQIPKENSMVMVVIRGKSQGFVVMVEEVEEVIIRGGENGGLIKIGELVENLDKMTKRIDGIIEAIKNSTTVAQDGGTSMKASIVASLNTLTEKEDFSKIENEKIRH